MTLTTELSSWLPPSPLTLLKDPSLPSPPTPGTSAPSTPSLPIPHPSNQPQIITFLRHCGCPFAEKTFLSLRSLSTNSSYDHIKFIAVSHSSLLATNEWLEALGGAGDVEVIVDEGREVYRAWGLGNVGPWHLFNRAAFEELGRLGREEGIKVRGTESGSRWQGAGSWAVSKEGVVVWGGSAGSAEEGGGFEEAVRLLEERGSNE